MADSPLRTIAESVQWSETNVPFVGVPIQITVADPRRVLVAFANFSGGQFIISTNPDPANTGGIALMSPGYMEFEIRKHGSLVGAEWWILNNGGVGLMTVFEVWFPRE